MYQLSVAGEPSINDIQSFAVTLHYYVPGTDETIEIARIDTSHGFVHFDRLYRADQPKDPVDMETPWEAEEHLREHWRQYADSYAHNHAYPRLQASRSLPTVFHSQTNERASRPLLRRRSQRRHPP